MQQLIFRKNEAINNPECSNKKYEMKQQIDNASINRGKCSKKLSRIFDNLRQQC